MEIQRICENGKVTLKLQGWLDATSAPELGKAVNAVDTADELVFDFENVEYMASAGLREVIAAYKKCHLLNAPFSVINVGDAVMNIFRITGIDTKITVIAK